MGWSGVEWRWIYRVGLYVGLFPHHVKWPAGVEPLQRVLHKYSRTKHPPASPVNSSKTGKCSNFSRVKPWHHTFGVDYQLGMTKKTKKKARQFRDATKVNCRFWSFGVAGLWKGQHTISEPTHLLFSRKQIQESVYSRLRANDTSDDFSFKLVWSSLKRHSYNFLAFSAIE